MIKQVRLAASIAALAVLGLLAASCGTARDSEPGVAAGGEQVTNSTAGNVQASNAGTGHESEAGHDDGLVAAHDDASPSDGHMTGVVAVSHEEGDGHAVELHGEADESDSNVKTIELVAYEWGYSPEKVEIPAGVPVRLVLKNEGLIEHEVQINVGGHVEMIGADEHGEAAHSTPGGHGQATDGVIHIHAGPHETSSETFIVASAGEYDFACEIPGHRAAGMVGSLHVEAHGT